MNQKSLIEYMEKIPAINTLISFGYYSEGMWWIKFTIDIEHSNAWNVVQELGCVVNYLSINERLPTVYYPVSPAPYLNGGPKEYLSWIIETTDKQFTPEDLKSWLEARLPNPVEDLEQWIMDE